MQSGYGGVSEIQQFMVDGCGSSLFSISPANAAAAAGGNPVDIRSASPHPLKYHPLPHPNHHHHHAQPPPAAAAAGLPPHFSHFHSIPITQQLFHQPAAHQFQLFHPHHHQQQYMPPEPRRQQLIPQHHHLGLDQESAPENSASPARIIPGSSSGPPSFLAPAMTFKLAVNESSGGGSREGINDDDGILQGDDGSESRLHRWQREEESSAIKELSWRPLDIDYINRNNKRCKEKEPESSNAKFFKKNKEVAESDDVPVAGGNNFKIFSELEAIYKPGGGGGGNAAGGVPNQTGSGSALTGDETPLLHAPANMTAPGVPAAVGGSETSAGEEATAKKSSKGGGRRRRKRRQRQLSAVAAFFESLVKQLMDHQESLHRKFLEVMESREQERTAREEAWRKQEAAKSSREAAARSQERALASSREAAIISFIEKITGESLNLPSKSQIPDIVDANKEQENTTNTLQIEPYSDTFNTGSGDPDSSKGAAFSTSRWPKAEVHALIRVRSGLEMRFQEPGLKGPLWEEVSATMAAMGYCRSAKRCKEKWENINKYFRKTKEKGKKRPQHSKTCPYFQQLDQLYSKSLSSTKPNPSSSSSPAAANPSAAGRDQPKDNSELLDAIVVPLPATEHQTFKVSDMSALSFDFNSKLGDDTGEGAAAAAPPREKDQVRHRCRGEEDEGAAGVEEDDDDDDEEEDEDEEEEEEEEEEEAQGESQGAAALHENLHQDVDDDEDDDDEDDLRDSSLFFDRLQS